MDSGAISKTALRNKQRRANLKAATEEKHRLAAENASLAAQNALLEKDNRLLQKRRDDTAKALRSLENTSNPDAVLARRAASMWFCATTPANSFDVMELAASLRGVRRERLDPDDKYDAEDTRCHDASTCTSFPPTPLT